MLGELATPPTERAQRIDGTGTRRRELVDHLDDGERGVLGLCHRPQRLGPIGEHLADDRRLHRVVEGATTVRREDASAEQLGEPVEHEEPDVEEAVAATPELSPQSKPGEVARHDHCDRRERVVAFGRGDRRGERVSGGRAEGHRHQPRRVRPPSPAP